MDNQNNPLLKLFLEKGKEITASPNSHISLQKETNANVIWFLEEGSVNLFAIELKGDVAEGSRTFLSTCAPSSVLFSIDKQYTFPILEVFAIPETPVKLWQLPASLFEEAIAKDPSLHPLFISSLEAWVHHISQYAEMGDREKHDIFLTINEEVSIQEEQTLCVKRTMDTPMKRDVLWVEVEQGSAAFLGNATIALQTSPTPFPLTYHLWLEATNRLQIHTYETSRLLENNRWIDSLKLFHKVIFHYYLTYREEKSEKMRHNLKNKLSEEDEILNNVFKDMVSLINPEGVASIPTSADPLFQACMLLGKLMRIQFVIPSDLPPQSDLSTQITALCNASRLHYRQVKLTKGWWKDDCGTLLAFFGEEQKPVVLRRKRGFYEMLDPETKKKKTVTKQLADQLIKLAFTFYRPFPDNLKGAKEMIVFYLQTHFKELLPIIVFGSIGSLISLFFPFATANIFNRAIPNANPSILIQLCIGLFLTALSTGVFFYLRSLGLVRMAGYASNGLQAALWDRLLKLPVNFFRKFTTGNLVQKVTSIEQIREILSDNSSRIILSGIFSFFYLIAMLIYAPLLSLMAILLMGFGLTITVICFHFQLIIERKIQNLSSNINGVLVQIISGVGKLRVAGAENNAFVCWAKLFTNLKRHELNAQTIHNIVLSLVAFLPMLSYAIIFGTVMMLKESGAISLGSFLGFNAAFLTFSAALLDVSSALMELVKIPPLWNNVRTILETPQELIVNSVKLGKLTGEISIDNVTFMYEKGGGTVLNNVSIHVAPKEFVAIIGPSGGGKSTLVRLLLGFETPNTGSLYYDGKELASLNLHEIRRQIGVVLQTGGIISGSIYDNLVCGGIYPKAKVDEALSLSGFMHDISSFPMGLHTFLPMGGETLSGGQKQRLLIARALLPQPKILLLDEATSALDNKVQDEISRNLDALDVTRIVIAHRLSTIKHADRIYVLKDGSIAQTGTFQELTSKPGLFLDMLNRQKL